MGVTSDRLRDHGVAQLRDRYSRGDVSLEEFSDRLDRLFAAGSAAEVSAAVGEAAAPPDAKTPPSHGGLEPGAYEALRGQLSPGEHVVWVGKPDPRRHFSPMDKFLVPFTAVWLFAAIMGALAPSSGHHAQSPGGAIFGAVWFGLIGLYLVFGRFILKARRKRRTLYAVTDRRVLALVRRRSGDQVNNGYLKTLPGVNERLRRDGSGTVIFGATSIRDGLYASSGFESNSGPVAFTDIPDAAPVARLVRALHDSAPSAAT